MTKIIDLKPYLKEEILFKYFREQLPGIMLETIKDFINSILQTAAGAEAENLAGKFEGFREHLLQGGQCLRSEGLVAFPTETVYGLGASVLRPKAVKKIFQAKGRPQDNPLIVHIASQKELSVLVREMPPLAEKLAAKFWPGPLTLVLPGTDRVPYEVNAGLPTVAVRMPAHPLALALIHETGEPLAAPSANLSGRPSPTRAEHVQEDLEGRVDIILDGGPCPVGVESTVVDCSRRPPVLLRPGGLSLELLRQEVPSLQIDPALKGKGEVKKPLSPGMKYRHYSPNTPVLLYEGETERLKDDLLNLLGRGKRAGLLVLDPEGWKAWLKEELDEGQKMENIVIRPLSSYSLFSELRNLDNCDINYIFVEGCSEHGLGLAVMNRLRKAATKIYDRKRGGE